jgi:CDP-glucose 4,6-dehydratase
LRQLVVFKNKKVLITGHTGFKGSWLALWLSMSGAKVMGISNKIITNPSNFKAIKLKNEIISKNVDIRNLKKTRSSIIKFQPDFIFHLAAQSLVKKSYEDPIYTYETNIIGTLNILESLRYLRKRCNVVLITSDKSYKNLETKRGYKENDLLGGIDPYSSSKASAELIIQTYINTFLKLKNNIRVGIARAGNVIGGGDWSLNRLIPDCVKSWSKNKRVLIRNPKSTRPWQHVLEALSGYLVLAYKLSKNKKIHGEVFNFGPSNKKEFNVNDVINEMKNNWEKVLWKTSKKDYFQHESILLKLNTNKAKKILNWKSVLSFQETIQLVTSWYKFYYENKKDIKKISMDQIKYFEKIFNQRV